MMKNVTYSRKEIAVMYFPYLLSKSASQRLTREIDKDPELKADLCLCAYRDSQRNFTPKQVAVLVRHWGNPDGRLIEPPVSYR